MSVEFLRALLHREDGLQLIADHLNTVLLQGTSLPEHRIAVLTLLPKLRDVCEPKDLRPIALMECTHKLYMSLLVGRIQATWPIPHFQQGGLPGTQLIDALFMFTNRLQRDALQLSHSIWVSADIEAAFDSVNWDKLRTTMFSLSSSQVHPELHRLLYEISSHGLLMEYFKVLLLAWCRGKAFFREAVTVRRYSPFSLNISFGIFIPDGNRNFREKSGHGRSLMTASSSSAVGGWRSESCRGLLKPLRIMAYVGTCPKLLSCLRLICFVRV